jgi:hypothetical protein
MGAIFGDFQGVKRGSTGGLEGGRVKSVDFAAKASGVKPEVLC